MDRFIKALIIVCAAWFVPATVMFMGEADAQNARVPTVVDDWGFAASAQVIRNRKGIVLISQNMDVDASPAEDMWDEGGTLSYLSAAETMNIVSTSAADDAGSTGATLVRIDCLDDDYEEVTENVVMNGVSNVETTITCLRVQNLVTLTAGSGGVNAGTITATASSAGTVQRKISIGEGLSKSSHYTVPAGKRFGILRVEFNAAKISGGANPQIVFRGKVRQIGLAATAAWVEPFSIVLDTAATDSISVIQPVFPILSEKTDIRLTADSDTANTEVRARMYGVLF